MVRTPCCKAEGLKKGAWTPEEDEKLVAFVKKHGEGGWRTLPEKAGLQRCGKSCRLRWANYLRPDIKRGRFSSDEAETIIKLHAVKGNKWSDIARHLPGRTDNEIKNYWNTHIKKHLVQNCIDPTTHKPVNRSDNQKETDKTESSSSGSARLLNEVATKLAGKVNSSILAWIIHGGCAHPKNGTNSDNATSKLLNKMETKPNLLNSLVDTNHYIENPSMSTWTSSLSENVFEISTTDSDSATAVHMDTIQDSITDERPIEFSELPNSFEDEHVLDSDANETTGFMKELEDIFSDKHLDLETYGLLDSSVF